MKDKNSKKEFKVVKILDEYTVIINAGEEQGINTQDKFQILDKKGSVVKDPDTNEVIGSLDLIKATVYVSEIQEKMCICTSSTIVKYNNAVFSGLNAISNSVGVSEKEKLNVELTQITGSLRRSDEKIRIGDTVRLIKSSK